MNTSNDNATNNITQVKNYLMTLQDTICQQIEKQDGKAQFQEELWQHANGGGGRTRVIEKGALFEKGGVNFSHIHGTQLPDSATQTHTSLENKPFQALGVSLVLHPDNPYIPTVHMNVRFFTTLGNEPIWWFGGGYDLTPYYGDTEDCIHWHTVAKSACTPFGKEVYPQYKKWCDDYFYLKHRKEPRGIGGLFFDQLNQGDFEKNFAFLQSVGNSFLPAYIPIVEKHKNTPFTEKEKIFQSYRRGRYAEFNLIWDRGTAFGLQSNGRTESILMSLPPRVQWDYNWRPEPHSKEDKLSKTFLIAKDWIKTT